MNEIFHFSAKSNFSNAKFASPALPTPICGIPGA